MGERKSFELGAIRSYAPEDLPELVEVWYRASIIAHDFLSDEFLSRERTEIEHRWMPVAETTVFEQDGRVVGFMSLIGNEVGAIFVHPDHQRRGIGRALMDHAKVSHASLELDVFEANAGGRRFYEEYGFRVIGRSVHEPTGQPQLRLRLD